MRHTMLVLLLVAGCSTRLYPTATGFHARDPLVDGGSQQTYVIWSNHVGISHYLTGVLLQTGHRVVERSRVEQIFDEQRFRLTHSPDRETDVLHIGAMAGATQVIFVQVEADGRHRESVSLRSVEVESGTVRWAGTATVETSDPFVTIDSPEQSLIGLAWLAFRRATCATERGWRWEEPSWELPWGGCMTEAAISGQSSSSAASFDGERQEQARWALQQEEAALRQEQAWLRQEYTALEQSKAALERERTTLAPGDALALAAYGRRFVAHKVRQNAYEDRRVKFQQRLAAYKARGEAAR